jgi:hypothetical protein
MSIQINQIERCARMRRLGLISGYKKSAEVARKKAPSDQSSIGQMGASGKGQIANTCGWLVIAFYHCLQIPIPQCAVSLQYEKPSF